MAEMSDAERDNFLGEVRVAVLAIERDGKGPMCAPVWYRYTSGGTFEIAMADASAKAFLLRRAGHASLCIQQESRPYKYVTVEGEVEVSPMDDATTHDVILDIATRYLGTAAGRQYADNFPGHQEALVTLTPRRWRTEVL